MVCGGLRWFVVVCGISTDHVLNWIFYKILNLRFFKVFTIYWRGGHLGHVTWTIYTNFRSPFPRRLHIKFGFDWPSGFGGEDV